MTEFFKSAQVRAALAELAEIQDDLAHTMANPRILSDEEKKDYVRKLKLFRETKNILLPCFIIRRSRGYASKRTHSRYSTDVWIQ